jgi:hypothetical protein
VQQTGIIGSQKVSRKNKIEIENKRKFLKRKLHSTTPMSRRSQRSSSATPIRPGRYRIGGGDVEKSGGDDAGAIPCRRRKIGARK